MSRIVPLLRQSPATTASITQQTIAPTTRCISTWSTGRCHGRGEIITENSGDHDDTRERLPRTGKPTRNFEDIFISSLVAAGTCRKHGATKRPGGHASQQLRSFSSRQRQQYPRVATPAEQPKISQHEYAKIVDFYTVHSSCGEKKEAERRHFPLASRLVMTPEQEQAEEQRNLPSPYQREILQPENEEQRSIIKSLRELTSARLGTIPLEQLWSVYQAVQSPRTVYLDDELLRRLLQHLGFVEYWHEKDAMQRYFQLLDDCVAAGAPVDKHDWTTAVAYAGRWMKHTTSAEVKAAIEAWMRMEEAGHTADHVTLNVLFDVAVKAGRFALADTIYKEIRARDMPLDRHFRGSLIYYAGLRRDGDDVRRAFREFVASGEIVDTTVMNAVILSLLRAGEAAAAEQVFTRMKRLGEEKFSVRSPGNWIERKELRRELTWAAHRLRAEKDFHEASFFGAQFSSEERREQVQKLSPVAPDTYTYTILMQYHANTSGDIERIWQLLQEMGEQGLRPHTAAYAHILKGFRLHGGYAFSEWSHRRLEVLWKVILRDMEMELPVTKLPASTTDEAVVTDHSQSDSDLPSHPIAMRPTGAGENVDDWAADDASQFGTPEAHDTASIIPATAVPLAGIMRSMSKSPSQHEADDFDMLGAMMAEHAHSHMGTNTTSTRDATEAEKLRPGSLAWGSITSPASSFWESVSLQHLANAALLPEGGTRLEDSDVPQAQIESQSPVLSENRNITPLDGADTGTGATEQPTAIKKTPSFSDSLSLRHSTDAALLPEGGTSLDGVNISGNGSEHNYMPFTPTLEKPGVVAVTGPTPEDDDFDSLPIWRRHREQFNYEDKYHRDNSSAPHTERRLKLAPGQKPVAFTATMALEAVKAFYQCCGRDRMLQVWDEISMKWHDGTEQERTRVANEVGQMVRHASRYEDLDRASR